MRNLLISLILLGLSQVCWSHPGAGHGHTDEEHARINGDQAQYVAKESLAQMVEMGKISTSWLKIEPEEAYKKVTDRGTEWVVEFKDPKATDKARSKVYVFMGLTGEVAAFKLAGK